MFTRTVQAGGGGSDLPFAFINGVEVDEANFPSTFSVGRSSNYEKRSAYGNVPQGKYKNLSYSNTAMNCVYLMIVDANDNIEKYFNAGATSSKTLTTNEYIKSFAVFVGDNYSDKRQATITFS